MLFKCYYAVLYLFWVIIRWPVLTGSIVLTSSESHPKVILVILKLSQVTQVIHKSTHGQKQTYQLSSRGLGREGLAIFLSMAPFLISKVTSRVLLVSAREQRAKNWSNLNIHFTNEKLAKYKILLCAVCTVCTVFQRKMSGLCSLTTFSTLQFLSSATWRHCLIVFSPLSHSIYIRTVSS